MDLHLNEVQNATDLLDLVDPLLNDGYFRTRFIWRGVGSSDYDLIPSALRRKSLLFNGTQFIEGPSNKWIEQIRLEIDTILFFLQTANEQGLSLPRFMECRNSLWEVKYAIEKSAATCWPPFEALSIMALAQHYGIATRLLDWSYDPLVSLYFAAKNAIRDPECQKPDAKLAIWCVDPTSFKSIKSRKLRHVVPDYASNLYLSAQKGTFTVEKWDISKEDYALLDSAETATHSQGNYFPDSGTSTPRCYKYLLPSSQARALLHLLHLRGVDGASVFPDFNGIKILRDEIRTCWPSVSEWHSSQVRKTLQDRCQSIEKRFSGKMIKA